jgi:hypothetical protein
MMDEAGFAIIPYEPTPSAQSQSGPQGQSTQGQSETRDQSDTRTNHDTPEDIDGKYERLWTHRRRLDFLLKQKAVFGLRTDPHILIEIEDICREIRDIKQQLRDLGEVVDDDPIDNSDRFSGGATGTADAFLLVEEKYIEKTSEVYIAPANYPHAQRVLKDSHVVVLCGSAEKGTRMTGVRLLRDLQIADIHQWDPSTEISALQALGAQSQAHLIHQMKIDAQVHLGKNELQQLSSQLRRQQSYLVITIDETSPLVMQLISDYAILWDKEPSDLQLLVKMHLLWYTSELRTVDRVQELCDRAAPLLHKRNWPPGRLASLAAQLVQTDGDEAKIQEVVGGFERDVKEQLAAWFLSWKAVR